MQTKAIFWDFDGTLVLSNHLWSSSVFKAIGGKGNPYGITFETVRPYMKTGFTWHAPENEYPHLTGHAWWVIMCSYLASVYKKMGVEPEQAKKASRNVRDIILNLENYVLYKDAVSTLEKCLERGCRNYILSNNYPELEETVSKLGLSTYFSGLTVSAKIGYEKPRKELFDYALNLAGYPEIAYMVGDNPIADIEGANRAGMISVLVHKNRNSHAKYKFDTLEDILQIL